jgi:hypothetical protein
VQVASDFELLLRAGLSQKQPGQATVLDQGSLYLPKKLSARLLCDVERGQDCSHALPYFSRRYGHPVPTQVRITAQPLGLQA